MQTEASQRAQDPYGFGAYTSNELAWALRSAGIRSSGLNKAQLYAKSREAMRGEIDGGQQVKAALDRISKKRREAYEAIRETVRLEQCRRLGVVPEID